MDRGDEKVKNEISMAMARREGVIAMGEILTEKVRGGGILEVET